MDPSAESGDTDGVGDEAPRRWRRRVAVSGACLVLLLGSGAAYAWNRGWLTETYLAASRPCGDLRPSVEILPAPAGGPMVTLTSVATGVLEPTALAFHPRLAIGYLAERAGAVRAVRDGTVDPSPMFDLAGDLSTAGEQGLLGLVVDPPGDHLYAYLTNADRDWQLVAIPLDEAGQARPDHRRALIGAHLPDTDHNGGGLTFGPDGMLYLGVGDGGEIGDRQGFAQSSDTLLGKVLRIDPRPLADTDPPYAVPPGNPGVGRPGVRPEIWLSGVRNPWRLAFDLDGHLWLPDLGHRCMEEVNLLPPGPAAAGANMGWNRYEGSRPFLGGDLPGRIDPLFEYPHEDGRSAVVGGVVVRDPALSALSGSYLVGDFCQGRILAVARTGDVTAPVTVHDIGVEHPLITSFAADGAGRVWVLTRFDGVFRLDPPPAI